MTDVIAAPAAVKPIHHWVGGRSYAGASGRSGAVYNPARGVQTGAVDFASVEEVDAAVQAARAAFPSWRALSLSRRAELFFRIHRLFDDHRADLARLLTAEHGKVFSDAMGEVARGLEVLEFCCGLPALLKGGFSEQASNGIDVYSIRQPLGVVAGITPFNFPVMVPMWMWAPALACGNTFVLKPSEKDPSASIRTAELLAEAGVPDGVFNVVHGDKVAVDALLEHPDVAAVSFVGSTPIARYVYETATARGKRCQALGGAKNHMIVLPDADIDMAADAAVSAAYGSAGERCMAVSMVVAVGDVADPLGEVITELIPNVKVGDGTRADSEMGPLITREHRDKVASYLDLGEGELVVDGREGCPADGFFLGPSLIDRLEPDAKAYRDEIFGPVLGITRVDTYAEAVELVNENPYGNGTAIFTRDGGVARQFQFDAQAGMVGINVPIPVPVAYYSFGGWKASLFGDRHIYGPEGIDFYTRGKVVTARWPDPATPRVAGVRTFMRAPHTADLAGVEAAVVGIPFDTATSYRTGARFGPEAIRSASALLRPYHPALEVNLVETLSVVDYGDLPVSPGDTERTYRQVEEGLAPLVDASVFPLALGGDHSVTLAELRALARRLGPLALVQLDAHGDTWDEYFGQRFFHGTTFRRALEERLIEPAASVQAGLRGSLYDAEDVESARRAGFEVLSCDELRSLGPEAYGELVRARTQDRPVFLSFDVDVLDPAFAPGTGTPEVGGLATAEALAFLRALRGLHLAGADVVEVSPPYDGAGQPTALAAANVAYELLSLRALSRLSR